jgi:Flp pilus assembly protein TadB
MLLWLKKAVVWQKWKWKAWQLLRFWACYLLRRTPNANQKQQTKKVRREEQLEEGRGKHYWHIAVFVLVFILIFILIVFVLVIIAILIVFVRFFVLIFIFI